jgi:hypothetical protein
MGTKLLINKNSILKRLGRFASAAKCNNSKNNAKVTCVITSERDRDTGRERDAKWTSNR